MKRTFSLIIIVCWVFAACQATPKQEIVQSKNDGVMERKISEGEKVHENKQIDVLEKERIDEYIHPDIMEGNS